MLDKKLEEFVLYKNQIKELEAKAKTIQDEIKGLVKSKTEVWEYVVSKRSRLSYSLKEWIDLEYLREKYPSAISMKVDAKEIYRIAENPDDLVSESVSEYLEVRKNNNPETGEIDLDI